MRSSKVIEKKAASRKSRSPQNKKTKKGKVKFDSTIETSDDHSMNEPRIGTFEEAP